MLNSKTLVTVILLGLSFELQALSLDELKYTKDPQTDKNKSIYQLMPKCIVNRDYDEHSKDKKELLRDQRIICVTIQTNERDQHAN